MYPSFHQSNKGSALLIGMWMIIVLTIIGIVFIEKIHRFSESTENIEQSNVAYYLATAAIERTIYTTNKKTPWDIVLESSGAISTPEGYAGIAQTGTNIIPISGYGNSDYDKSWNMISLGSPVQIVVPNGVNWSQVQFYFRIPNLDSEISTNEVINPLQNTLGIVNWVLSSSGEALFASGQENTFRGDEINVAGEQIDGKVGTTNENLEKTFDLFNTENLGSGAECANFACTLKLSLLRPVLLSDGRVIPFLEYRIDFNQTISIPDQFMHLTTQGWANGFGRTRTIEIPQITTSTALDFTVLQ